MSWRLTLACLAVAVLTIAPAIFEGLYVNRWGTPTNMAAAAENIKQFPREFGEWKIESDGDPLSDDVCRALGLAGYVSRTYTNRSNGAVVNLLLMVGQSGPLLRHPPYICYANRANEQVGDMTTFHVDSTTPKSEFNLLEYKRPQTLTNDRFLVAYSMATGPDWSVPELPRVKFGGAPMLYKVQMLTSLDPSQQDKKGVDLLKRFAADFCAEFQKHLPRGSGS